MVAINHECWWWKGGQEWEGSATRVNSDAQKELTSTNVDQVGWGHQVPHQMHQLEALIKM